MSKLRFHKALLTVAFALAIFSSGGQAALAQGLPVTRTEECNDAVERTEKPAPVKPSKSATAFISDLNSARTDSGAPDFLTTGRKFRMSVTDEQNTQGGGGQAAASTVAPLSAEEKLKYGLRSAFLSPAGYLFSGISAAITEATEEDLPHKTRGDRVADGLSRFAIKSGTRSTRALLGSGLYPVIFKQDPRYKPSSKKGFGARALHAASRVFVTEDDGGNVEPNYSRLAGTISASALSNIWEQNTPGRDRIGVGPTFSRFGSSIGFDVLQFIVFREFGPDIRKKVFRR